MYLFRFNFHQILQNHSLYNRIIFASENKKFVYSEKYSISFFLSFDIFKISTITVPNFINIHKYIRLLFFIFYLFFKIQFKILNYLV